MWGRLHSRYHEWMQSEELQRLTASEPLSLEQEYEMQCSWRDDTDSEHLECFLTEGGSGGNRHTWSPECTFIVLDSELWPGQEEENSMVGDVNLFLTNTEDPTVGEIEIMIAGQVLLHSLGLCHCGCVLQRALISPWHAQDTASSDKCLLWLVCLPQLDADSVLSLSEPSCRGRGFGKEATLLMMAYGVRKLGITKFEAKIGQENEASICMFRKLHFKEVGVNSIFQEVTLRLDVSDQERQWLLEQTKHVEEKSYAELKQPAGVQDS
ncbi:hypothetical protein EK904_006054 [Melospiza melodia maxima]|nr:hypothetical protein EK904_006054 [Melospiza melodia maxima]